MKAKGRDDESADGLVIAPILVLCASPATVPPNGAGTAAVREDEDVLRLRTGPMPEGDGWSGRRERSAMSQMSTSCEGSDSTWDIQGSWSKGWGPLG